MVPRPPQPPRAPLEHLARVEDYLRRRAEPQNTGWYVRDVQADVHYWSPEVFTWFGLPVADRAPGVEAFLRLLAPTSISPMVAAFDRWRRDRSELDVEYQVCRPDGTTRQLRSFSRTLPTPGSGGCSMIGTVVDLTDLHSVQAALAEATRALGGSAPAVGFGGSGQDIRAGSGRSGGGLSPHQFGRVRELIEGRIRDRVAVAELAAAVRLSEAHFIRAFKQTTGVTPHRYMLQRKLELARASLVARRAEKVATIALDFGFCDQSHFTRHFRKRFGCTPVDVLRAGAGTFRASPDVPSAVRRG